MRFTFAVAGRAALSQNCRERMRNMRASREEQELPTWPSLANSGARKVHREDATAATPGAVVFTVFIAHGRSRVPKKVPPF